MNLHYFPLKLFLIYNLLNIANHQREKKRERALRRRFTICKFLFNDNN